jgi:hypothetical protein
MGVLRLVACVIYVFSLETASVGADLVLNALCDESTVVCWHTTNVTPVVTF